MSFFDRWRRLPDDLAGDEEPRDPELARLVARARALPSESEPSRDLWSGIENRIAAARASEAEPPSRPRWVSVFPRPVLAAAFATVLIIATSTATLWVARPLQPASEELAIRAIAERVRARDGVGEMRASLLSILESRSAQLPAGTVAALEQNLAAIDRAIAEIHLALEASPGDHALSFLLADAYRREAELLERLEAWLHVPEEVRS
jgi:hypothetical protein